MQIHHKYEGTHNALGATVSFFMSTSGARVGTQQNGGKSFIDQCIARTPGRTTSRGQGTILPLFEPSKVFGQFDMTKFWSYDGSMTNPPCTEGIKWLLMEQVSYISQAQVDKIKAYNKLGAGVSGSNARSIQPYGERRIWYQNGKGAIATSVGLVSLIAFNALF